MSNGQANHGTIWQVDRSLDEAFAKGSTSDDNASVVVLNGSRDNLSSRCRIAVNQDNDLAFGEQSSTLGLVFGPLSPAPVGVNNKIASLQELLRNLYSCLEIASAILLQIENKRLHARLRQFVHTLDELIVRCSTKTADTDVAHLGTNHISGINSVDGNLVANDVKRQRVLYASTHNGQHNFCSLRTTQTFNNLFLGHLDTCDNGVVDFNNTVASNDAHLFGRAVGDRLDDEQRILSHIKLHTNALEITLQGFVGRFHLLCCQVAGVRVEFL